MQERLEKTPSLNYDEDNNTKVACTTMAFRNADMIDMLRKRGALI